MRIYKILRQNKLTDLVVVNGLNLNKSLASQEQLSQLMTGNGISIAGDGSNALLKDAPA